MKISRLFAEKQLNSLKKANNERKLKIAQKYNYKTVIGYKQSLERRLKENPIVEKKEKNKKSKEVEFIDKVIAFDVTASMDRYINNVKMHVEKLISHLFKSIPNLRIKIVAFGDYCDMRGIKNNMFGDAYQETKLTNNQQDLIDFIKNAKSTNGGDIPEFYELVIRKINRETKWREGSRRSVLLIGDSIPHNEHYYNSSMRRFIDWRDEGIEALKLGIEYDTICIYEHTSSWYRDLSKITNGINTLFSSSDKTQQVIYASTLSRSSDPKSRAAYSSFVKCATDSADLELIGMFKSFDSKLNK